MKSSLRILTTTIVVTVIVGASFMGGVVFGYQSRPEAELVLDLSNKEVAKPSEVDFGAFWRVWLLLNERYIPVSASSTETTVVSTEEKVWGAIEGLVESLGDPYTVFMPPQEAAIFEEEVSGRFGGIGIEIGMRNDLLTVIAPLPDSPADRAGIKTGDRIVGIDGENATKMSINDGISRIRGEIGTKVDLTIAREDASGPTTFDVNLTRSKIEIPTLDTEVLPGNIFLIKLYNFGGTAETQFQNALRQFVKLKSDKLIIDLRGNPGGYLDAAVNIASWFLPEDTLIVSEERRNSSETKAFKSDDRSFFNNKLKMAILVDGGSASASEIVAGALQEHGVAKLVGEQTFGKGSVQELVPVADGASLKVTVARWLTPKGKSISDNGLSPDLVVKPATSTDIQIDPQLDAAVKLIKEMKR